MNMGKSILKRSDIDSNTQLQADKGLVGGTKDKSNNSPTAEIEILEENDLILEEVPEEEKLGELE